jgi:hypothetical protein
LQTRSQTRWKRNILPPRKPLWLKDRHNGGVYEILITYYNYNYNNNNNNKKKKKKKKRRIHLRSTISSRGLYGYKCDHLMSDIHIVFQGCVKMDLREIWWDGVDWIDVVQDRDHRRALVNTVLNLRVP